MTKLAEVIGKSKVEMDQLREKVSALRKTKNRNVRIIKTASKKKDTLRKQIEAAKAGTRLTMEQITARKEKLKKDAQTVAEDIKKSADAAAKEEAEIKALEEELAKVRKEKGLKPLKKSSSGAKSPKPGFVKALSNRGWVKVMEGRKVVEMKWIVNGALQYSVKTEKEGWSITGKGIKKAVAALVHPYNSGTATLDTITAGQFEVKAAEKKAS
ncbi:MAG: hypothetical protein DRJ03_27060 [Chloroflexi bacterium]|nr:MAG: hypothetical protein DRJ03_27060 [Chloroflexota bacterium]